VAIDRTRAAYDRIAAAYVERNALHPPRGGLATLVDRFTAALPAGARVLDLGCGPAHETAWLRERGLNAIGGDLSDGMLAQARGFTEGPLVQLDMRAVPFADGAFAGVWCVASLLHIPKTEAPGVLAEVRRVLGPPGVLVLSVQEGEGERWDGGYVEGVERFFARYTPDQVRRLLAGAGFTDEALEREVAGSRTWLGFLARVQG
jgi:SAM-dependent methyltransferase